MGIDTDLWFLIRDVRPLAWHASWADHRPGEAAALHLAAQGSPVFLTASGHPRLLLDPSNPHSVQRAYPAGRAHPAPGEDTTTAPVRPLGTLPLRDATHLLAAIESAHGSRCWLVVTPSTDGLRWRVATRPGAPARTGWIAGELRVLGLDAYQGEYAEHHTWRGWCLARFPAATARTIAAEVNALPRKALRRGLTRLRLTNQPTDRDGRLDADRVLTVGPDPDGCYRIGARRWQWITLDRLEPEERIVEPFDGPIPDGVDPASMPTIGQLAHEDGANLTWLSGTTLYQREYAGGHIWPGCPAQRVTRTAHPTTRAAEYLLRSAAADTVHTATRDSHR